MEINQILDEYCDHKKKFVEKISSSLNEAFREFFERVGDSITCIAWHQMTPYFNDGEECVFRVGDVYFSNVPLDEIDNITDYGEYDGESTAVFSVGIRDIKRNEHGYRVTTPLGLSQDVIDACIDIEEVISHRDMEEILQDVYGDHVVIRVTKSGINISEFDHD